jgi:pimeloyl-ACP methyl ester carboxylesterase
VAANSKSPDRRIHAASYAYDDGMRAGFEYFRNFEQDAKDFAFRNAKLNMPFLVFTAEKSSGTFLLDQAKLVANNVTGTVVKGSGHWLMEEATDQVVSALVALLD